MDRIRRRMVQIARHRCADAREVLLEGVFYWVLDGPGPVPDQGRVRRIVERQMTHLAAALRAEIARQGYTPAELDALLGWPEGRTAHLLAAPSELDHEDADLLCQQLETSLGELFESSPGEP